MSYTYESDERAIARVIAALSDGETIDHGTARAIASPFSDNSTIGFVSTGDIPQGDALGLMERINRGVDPRALALNSEALTALCSYLLEREGSGDTGSVPGWPDMWVPRHVDYPHEHGQLPDCWCYEEDESECEGHYDDDYTLTSGVGIGEATYCDGSCRR